MSKPVEHAKKLLLGILKKSKVDGGHGFAHATIVLNNSNEALKHAPHFSKDVKLAIRLASLLHDIDDRKFFPEGSSNAENILKEVIPDEPEIQTLALDMIDKVSCSKNGIGKKESDEEYLYYPRWSDRLEALGAGGILRAYHYSIHRGRPLDEVTTARTNSPELLYGMIATPRRFKKYLEVKESVTFIDHFYDKLLHLRKGFQTSNPFYLKEVETRHKIIEHFVLDYSTTQLDIPGLINKHCFGPI